MSQESYASQMTAFLEEQLEKHNLTKTEAKIIKYVLTDVLNSMRPAYDTLRVLAYQIDRSPDADVLALLLGAPNSKDAEPLTHEEMKRYTEYVGIFARTIIEALEKLVERLEATYR